MYVDFISQRSLMDTPYVNTNLQTAASQMNTTTNQVHMNTFETNIHPLKTQKSENALK